MEKVRAILRRLLCFSLTVEGTLKSKKRRKEVYKLTARERIIAIKLYEKAEEHPEYAKKIGIIISKEKTEGRD